jgi:hypothetical protein
MFQDFDLVVLDEVVLVAQRYRQDVLAAGHDDDFNREKRHNNPSVTSSQIPVIP